MFSGQGFSSKEYLIPVSKEASLVKTSSLKFPHNCEAILKDANPPISVSSVNLSEQLRNGVFLKPTKLIKYWVDERSNTNCFMLFARNLSITWSDDPNYWTWFPHTESPNETNVEAVELKNVCWLDITGKFDTRNLTPGISYEVVFKVKLEDPAYGWDAPVNLKLVLPNGKEKPQEQKMSLRELPRYKWVDIRVGEFVPEKSTGEITFSMYEHEAGTWKKGLFLKGVAIRPKHIN
ncbi:Protein PHLOEM PROTEIN 2-LIKE A1 [Cardamine amara subsp. amara]|uniref:Protein PHLOEM PROTEIN 2-LIKE A1 n=1 Tax=Cardamine amara subsp. amara TaxID=228776 RepID=A0ABD1API7_CARAN